MNQGNRFEDKVAVVTGGGSGIGRATAGLLLAEGAKVVLNGRREAVLADTAKALDPGGERVLTVPGDVGAPATGTRIARAAEERFGGVDILINAAGIFAPTPFADHSEETFDRYVGAILKGTFFTTQALVPSMKARGGGAVVNVGSMWASQAVAATPSAAYSAAKAGVHALTKNLAIELGADGIRVNTVAPAVVKTPVYETFLSPEQIPEVVASFTPIHPLGRVGEPIDLASAIAFLAGPEASWITGVVLPVDGGVMAGLT